MARNPLITEQRSTSRNLRVLTHMFGFLRSYRKNLAAALLALWMMRASTPSPSQPPP